VRVRCNIMPIARGYSPVSQPLFLIARLTPWDSVGPLCSSYLELEAPARPGLSLYSLCNGRHRTRPQAMRCPFHATMIAAKPCA
jgi:hypothetical protein